MTSLYFDPALLEGPSDPEPREQLIVNGRYYLPPLDDPTGKRRSLQRVTNFIKQLSEQGGLVTWKLRSAVIGLARDERRYDLACSINPDSPRGKQELDQLIEECIDFANAGPSGGNITGTALHNYTDDVAGSYPIRVRDKWVPKLENYQRALHDKGLRVVPGLQERLVVSERYGTCGRLDDVYEDPFGTLRVGDRKSQKDFPTWWEVGAQLALYQSSDAMWNEAECRWEEMPALADDFCHVAWMPLSHPAAKKGGDVDTVTIYDIPLAGPREVLEWCLRVRTLRTQARQWGQERPDLDAFAATARDIRDAETHDDLRKIAANRTAGNWSDELHQPMAIQRWEELAAAPKPEPVSVAQRSVDDAVYVRVESGTQFDADQTTLTVTGTHDAVTKLALSAEHVRNMTPGDVAQTLNGPGPLSQEEIERRRADVFDRLRQSGEKARAINDVQNFAFTNAPRVDQDVTGLNRHAMERLPLLQDVVTFDPALFVGPEQEEATFLDAGEGATVPGPQRPAETVGVSDQGREAFNHLGADVVNDVRLVTLAEDARTPWEQERALAEIERRGLTPVPNYLAAKTPEERQALKAQAWSDDEGMLRKPMEWAAHFDLTGFRISADPDGVWCKPMPLKTFRHLYATEIAQCEAESRQQAHPVATAQFTHSRHENATVVELSEPIPLEPNSHYEVTATLGGNPLDAVPIKIVREVCTRANNSQSSRGRVRLLNDLGKKYAQYQDVLLPALLREWLTIDGGPTSMGAVKLTEGSSRSAMGAKDAGPISLTDYLATKEAPKSSEATAETEAAPAPVPDRDAAEADVTSEVAAKIRAFADDVAEIRKPYRGLVEGANAGKHTIARLIELAKDAASGAERWKVFEAISRYHTWTGEIAAEINQHYLDAGQATVDFDPYFAAQQDAEDDPATAQDALHLLEGVESRDQLTLMWSTLATKPYFQDQALQEGLLAKMMSLKK